MYVVLKSISLRGGGGGGEVDYVPKKTFGGLSPQMCNLIEQ